MTLTSVRIEFDLGIAQPIAGTKQSARNSSQNTSIWQASRDTRWSFFIEAELMHDVLTKI